MKGKIPVILALLVSMASPAAAATAVTSTSQITVEEEGRLIDTTSSPVIMHNNQPYVNPPSLPGSD
ncbi:hypothetical protein [Brevibacillus centrosporus]|uniref:hypothetical protein n=1 Tax=Brevibacillus centrosporus TaxID=54910 RepID=UPI002E1F62B8|nr:hypothetical protein [Brevibacillus centrosporus]